MGEAHTSSSLSVLCECCCCCLAVHPWLVSLFGAAHPYPSWNVLTESSRFLGWFFSCFLIKYLYQWWTRWKTGAALRRAVMELGSVPFPPRLRISSSTPANFGWLASVFLPPQHSSIYVPIPLSFHILPKSTFAWVQLSHKYTLVCVHSLVCALAHMHVLSLFWLSHFSLYLSPCLLAQLP